MQRLLSCGLAVLLAAAPCAAQARAVRTDTLAISIEDAVALALRAGDEARIAAAQLDVAEAQLDVARASALPQLRLSSTYSHVYKNARSQSISSIFNQPNTYNTNLNLSQTIFQGGREWGAIRAASRVREASRLTAAETRAQVSLDVQRAYLDALFQERLVNIQSSNLELASQRLTQVEQFERAGRAARYDVLRARVERANLEPQVIQAANDRDLALLDLKRLVNVPPERPVRLTTAIDADAVPALLASVGDTTFDDGRERSTVRAAELTAQARRIGVSVARADWLPTISVFLQDGYQAFPLTAGIPFRAGHVDVIGCPPGSAAGRVCTQQNGGWFEDRSLGVQLSWALFDGLRTKGNIDLAQAQARLAELQLQQTRENVATEVAAARAELTRARALFEARQQNVSEAREAFSLASLRFTRGLGTQLETSDAQIALLTAQVNEARSVYDLYLATATLARALGRPVPFPPGAKPPVRIGGSEEK